MQAAFAVYAQVNEAASIRRCSSTWNVLCSFFYSGDRLAANPVQLVGRPKPGKALPKTRPAPRSRSCSRSSSRTESQNVKHVGPSEISH